MVSDVHQRLRDATRADHERLEARADLLRRVARPNDRCAVVLRFWRLHAEVEAAVSPWLEALPDLELQARRRTAYLAADLEALGVAPPREPPEPPRAASVGEALGLLYVLEGSTLGGRVIRRTLEKQGSDMHGLSFLDPYGDLAGERWRGFLSVLERAARTPEAIEAVVRGALTGFRHAERRICEAQPA